MCLKNKEIREFLQDASPILTAHPTIPGTAAAVLLQRLQQGERLLEFATRPVIASAALDVPLASVHPALQRYYQSRLGAAGAVADAEGAAAAAAAEAAAGPSTGKKRRRGSQEGAEQFEQQGGDWDGGAGPGPNDNFFDDEQGPALPYDDMVRAFRFLLPAPTAFSSLRAQMRPLFAPRESRLHTRYRGAHPRRKLSSVLSHRLSFLVFRASHRTAPGQTASPSPRRRTAAGARPRPSPRAPTTTRAACTSSTGSRTQRSTASRTGCTRRRRTWTGGARGRGARSRSCSGASRRRCGPGVDGSRFWLLGPRSLACHGRVVCSVQWE